MGWQDAPVIQQQPQAAAQAPKWASAPVVNAQPERPGYFENLKNATEKAGAADIAHPGQAVPGMFEAGLNAVTGALSPIPGVVDTIVGRLGLDPENPTGDYQKAKEFFTYSPRSESGKAHAEQINAALRPVGDVLGYAGKKAGDVVRAVGAPEQIATDAEQMVPDMLGMATTRVPEAVGGVKSAIAERRAAPKSEAAPVPTTQELQTAKQGLYDAAKHAGVIIKPEATAKSAQIFRDVAREENLGKLPPKLAEAHAIIEERVANNDPLSLSDADKARQLINDAMKSNDAGDRRLGKVIKGRYDEFLDSLGPEDTLAGDADVALAFLKAARETNRRYENSRLIDNTITKAERAGDAKYTQAGDEHALRTEFKKLADNDKKMRPLQADQRQAIEDVARGGSTPAQRFTNNTLRNVGKFDPTSGGMAAYLANGFGASVGGALGGIAGGGAGMVLVPGVGFVAKRLATRMTRGNVAKAREALVGREAPQSAERLGAKLGNAKPVTSAKGASLAQALTRKPRTSDQIQEDLNQLDKAAQRLSPDEPLDSPRARRLQQQFEALQAELAAVAGQQAPGSSAAGNKD